MLPKERRIKRKEFSFILNQGKRFHSQNLTLFLAKNSTNSPENITKIAFSVSKKVYPKAVDRNKCRRRGYSVIKNNTGRLKDGFYLLFSFKKTGSGLKYENIEKEILELLSTSGVLI